MISIDFKKAQHQAESMRHCAEAMVYQCKKLHHVITEMRNVWKGKSADAYIKKLEAFCTKLEEDAKKCLKGAEAFQAKINRIKEAEDTASRAIEKARTDVVKLSTQK